MIGGESLDAPRRDAFLPPWSNEHGLDYHDDILNGNRCSLRDGYYRPLQRGDGGQSPNLCYWNEVGERFRHALRLMKSYGLFSYLGRHQHLVQAVLSPAPQSFSDEKHQQSNQVTRFDELRH